MWCDHCLEDSPTDRNPNTGYICCMSCGKVIDQDIYADEPTFVKAADGSSRLSGTTLNSIVSSQTLSRLKTIQKGKDEIFSIMTQLQMGGEGSDLHTQAGSFYEFALQKQFTRGRIVSHVAAVCLYLSCRVKELPYLLIDFSEPLQANVYVLGAVFLQLCKLLNLDEHHTIRRPVDPSLFIHRFTKRLLGRQNNAVSETALRIIASMKRDWMQTGRKPSGLCGAALYISALSHGFNYSKSDIVTIVHICEATLTKRLIEFENTESGCLTVEEFVARADKLDEEPYSNQLSRPGEVLCQHKISGEPHFAHGLCRECYNDFIKISGGLEGGAEPPAFQRAERQRMNNAKEGNTGEAGYVTELCDEQHRSAHNMGKLSVSVDHTSDTVYDSSASEGPKVPGEAPESTGHHTVDSSTGTEAQVLTYTSFGEEDNLSDIDDDEVDGYLHNEEEKRFKEIIWTAMNKEYLEEQAAKEAAAAVVDPSSKPKKERKRRRMEDAPPETAAEAAYSALGRKGHSSKINYNALGSIFSQETENKQMTGVESDGKEKKEATKYNDVDYGGNDYDGSYGNGVESFANNEEFDFEF